MADETQTKPEENAVTEGGVGLSLMDLRNVVTIIDVASERGAWKGPELSKIGSVREKFVEVITALAPATEGEASAETPAEAPAEAPEAEATEGEAAA